MDLAELKAHLWNELPVRKLMVGKRRVHNWVELAIENWDADVFGAVNSDYERDLAIQSVVQSIRRMDETMSDEEPKQYGFIWLLLLSGLVSLLVQLILKWWMDNDENKVSMAAWKAEMTK